MSPRSEMHAYRRRQVVISAILAALNVLSGQSAGAQISFTWSKQHQWYSGTNATCSGTVTTTMPGTWLTAADVKIGTDVLAQLTYDPGNHRSSWEFAIVFDSSHYSNGSVVSMVASGTPNTGQPGSSSQNTLIYNKAYVLGNTALSQYQQAIDDVFNQLVGTNIETITSHLDARPAILAAIPDKTVFYMWTHAGPGWFMDCPNATAVTAADVSAAVAQKGANRPPFNFVHIDACHSADNATLANAFGMTTIGPNDRAFLGFSTQALDDAVSEAWTARVWLNLHAGQTLTMALNNADGPGMPDEYVQNDHAALWQAYGDMYMTLRATYYLGPQGQWHN